MMNTLPRKPLLLAAGIAAGLAFSSCVAPYDTATIRTYDPGYTVSTLPSGYRSEVISGKDYYYYNGNYYRRSGDSYVVVDAPRSSRYYEEYTRYGNKIIHNHADGTSHVVDTLPAGYRTVRYQGTPYYEHDDRYYRRQGSRYISVPNPF